LGSYNRNISETIWNRYSKILNNDYKHNIGLLRYARIYCGYIDLVSFKNDLHIRIGPICNKFKVYYSYRWPKTEKEFVRIKNTFGNTPIGSNRIRKVMNIIDQALTIADRYSLK